MFALLYKKSPKLSKIDIIMEYEILWGIEESKTINQEFETMKKATFHYAREKSYHLQKGLRLEKIKWGVRCLLREVDIHISTCLTLTRIL